MHHWFSLLIEPLAQAARPGVIVEVGCADGAMTRLLAPLADELDATVHAIDPMPRLAVEELDPAARERVTLHAGRSLDVLPRIPAPDLLLLDGDKNWYTVISELRQVERMASEQERQPPVVVVGGVDWPYGRRDQYHDPLAIPELYRHPADRVGLVPGRRELVEGGLFGDVFNARVEAPHRSGVRTAVEDFVEGSPTDWGQWHVPGLLGMLVLAPRTALDDNGRLREVLEGTREAEFLRQVSAELETERLSALAATPRHAAAAFDEQVARLIGERDALAGETAAAQARADEAVERYRRFEQDLDDVRSSLGGALDDERARVAELRREVGELNRRLAADRQATETSDRQRDRLRTALAGLRVELVVAAAERDALARECDRMARELGERAGEQELSKLRPER